MKKRISININTVEKSASSIDDKDQQPAIVSSNVMCLNECSG